jgi:glycosyltransferase involved in cell wall biosynthesis
VSDRALAILWHRLRIPLPINLVVGNVPLYHATDFVLPPLRHSAGIVTVHDLSFILFPDHADSGLVRYLKKAVPASVRRARYVLADSKNTRNDILCLLDGDPDRVEVLYAGVERRFSPVQDEKQLALARKRLNLPWPFILTVSTIERRKNLARLVRAYGRLRARHGCVHKLVIAGRRGWLYEDVFAAVAELGLEEEVFFLGFIDDADLPVLYSLADLFVYPSIYEGFGLPPLEAMACGTPVVAAPTSCFPEVLGDACLFAPATEVDALAAAMERVLGDEGLAHDLRRRGLQRASLYTWEATARRLLDIYRRAVS